MHNTCLEVTGSKSRNSPKAKLNEMEQALMKIKEATLKKVDILGLDQEMAL